MVVENKPGAFGILAIEEMARARPDGYTLQIGNPGTNVLTPIIYKKKLKIDYDKDVTMVTRLSEVPLVLAATTKDFRAEDLCRVHRLRQGQPRQGALRQRRHRQQQSLRHGGVRASGRASSCSHLPNKGGGAAITNDLVTGDAHVALVNAASSAA